MTYEITDHQNMATEPVTDDSSRLGYGSVTPPQPSVTVRRVKPGRFRRAVEVREERWFWSCGASDDRGSLARWHGWASSHEEACRATGEVMREWAAYYDRRPWVLEQAALAEAGK